MSADDNSILSEEATRRCVLTKNIDIRRNLIRLVSGPQDLIYPDISEKLPGRGMWVTADRQLIDDSILSGALAKALSHSMKKRIGKDQIPSDLGQMIEKLLTRQVLDRLGLLKKSGLIVTGFDKIEAAIKKNPSRKIAALVMASDVASDSKRKMTKIAGRAAFVDMLFDDALFDRELLSKALGQENTVHVLVFEGGGAEKLVVALDRLCRMGKSGTSPHKSSDQITEKHQ